MQARYRLRDRRDFDQMRQQGRSFARPTLVLSIRPNGLGHNRYGVVVGKRLGTAVIRNRVRRRLREAMRQLHPQLLPGYDIIVIARPALVDICFGDLRDTLQAVLCQAKLKVE